MVSDRRVQYTRNVVREALLKLLDEKPLEKITVKEVCGMADINRATFYRYYTDIYDLYASIERELIQEIIPAGGMEDMNIITLTEKLFCVVYENQSFYREFFRSRIESEGIQRVIEETYEEVLVMIRQKNGCGDDAIFRYSLEYMKSGILGIMRDWVEGGCEDSPEKIAQIIAGIVEKQMEGIL